MQKYLYQHGYLNCSISSLKSGVCSSESWQKAIKLFQNNFKLQATGYLDQKTLEKMMVKRCSNEDDNSVKRKMIDKHSKRRKRDTASTKDISTFEMFKSLYEDHCRGVECIQPVEAMYVNGLPDRGRRFYDSRTSSPTRRKRSVSGRKVILWSFSNSTEVTLNYKVAVLYAHKSWSEVLPLKFYNTRRSDIADVEYTIKKGILNAVHIRFHKFIASLKSSFANFSLLDMMCPSMYNIILRDNSFPVEVICRKKKCLKLNISFLFMLIKVNN